MNILVQYWLCAWLGFITGMWASTMPRKGKLIVWLAVTVLYFSPIILGRYL